MGITSRFRDDTNLSWHTPAYIRFNRRDNWTGDITFHTAPSYDYRSGIKRMRITKEGDIEISGKLKVGQASQHENAIMLYPDSLNRVYIWGKEVGNWTDFYFWNPDVNRSQYIYARGFKTFTSTRTVPSAETSDLLGIIEQEVNKPIFDPAVDESPPSPAYSKDISEIAVASGILVLRLHVESSVLKEEIERLKNRINDLEEKQQ